MYNLTITDLLTGNVLRYNPAESLLFTQRVSLLLEPNKNNTTDIVNVIYKIRDKNNTEIQIGEEEFDVPITLDFKALGIRNFPSNSGPYTIIAIPVSERGLEEDVERTVNVNFDSSVQSDAEVEDEEPSALGWAPYALGGGGLGLLAGINLSDQLSAGYSFGYSLGNQTFRYNGGTHEIMLRYDYLYKEKRIIKSPRYFYNWYGD